MASGILSPALEAIRALSLKRSMEAAAAVESPVSEDPVILGARREKNVVILGSNDAMAEAAACGSELKDAISQSQEAFDMIAGDLRRYAKEKREAYNKAYSADISTVGVPYVDSNGLPAIVNITVADRYSVQKDVVLNNRDTFGPMFDRLFKVEESKKLKPNAEALIRGVFSDLGLTGEDLENTMNNLLETEVKVSVQKDFEKTSKMCTPNQKAVLDQTVAQAQPAVKF